jgi:alkylation response protein AidB-like acyl-CoA dehydrogenase
VGWALELTAEHARTRVQFGRPIGSFQAVAQRLATAQLRRIGAALAGPGR